MSRQPVTRLRETLDASAPPSAVIDATYREIGPKKRGFLHNVTVALIAIFWAAVIGFAIPQAWMFWESMGAYFAEN